MQNMKSSPETLVPKVPARIPLTSAQTEENKNTTSGNSRRYHYSISALYALWPFAWKHTLVLPFPPRFIVKHRHRINVQVMNHLLKIFGVLLGFFSFYLLAGA
jgi:hypothetical protein